VEAAEFGDLLERQRTIFDQPGGGRMGHERLGHQMSPLQMNRAAPRGAASTGRDVVPSGAGSKDIDSRNLTTILNNSAIRTIKGWIMRSIFTGLVAASL
jgi:hypothetical protein